MSLTRKIAPFWSSVSRGCPNYRAGTPMANPHSMVLLPLHTHTHTHTPPGSAPGRSVCFYYDSMSVICFRKVGVGAFFSSSSSSPHCTLLNYHQVEFGTKRAYTHARTQRVWLNYIHFIMANICGTRGVLERGQCACGKATKKGKETLCTMVFFQRGFSLILVCVIAKLRLKKNTGIFHHE